MKKDSKKISFLSIFQSIIETGITDDMSFERRRNAKTLNLVCFLGVIASLIFCITNTKNGKYLLAFINLITFFGCAAPIYFNNRKKYDTGPVIISNVLAFVFCLSAFLYKNNAEYYLLLNIVSILIVVKNKTVAFWLGILNALLFLAVYKFQHLVVYDDVGQTRRDINIVLWMVFFLTFLYYFKIQNYTYQNEIEVKNNLLEEQQLQLLSQKEQLEESNHQLTVLNKTKEKLFSIVAHDIRTPIAGLKTSLELFNQDIISKEEFIMLSTELSVQVDQLQNSLDNLLQWSHSQMSGIDVNKSKTALKPLVLETLHLLQHNLSGKNIKVDLATNEGFAIYADPNHIKLILRNLISNAIKFSYAGSSITLSAKKENASIFFSVSDTGTGMPQEKVDTLFQQNAIASQYGTSNEKGTGLGLMLCKEFIEKNGGSIMVESEVGKGSTFTFSIPAA